MTTFRSICICCLIVCSAWPQTGWSQTTAAPARPSRVEPIVTKERLFSIPYFLNPKTQQPAEVHLYVSGDRGENWFHYQQRTPEQQKFDFQAGEDGVYWFVVRTNRDTNKPNSSTRPEKIVIVDQSPPKLELAMQIGSTGELVAVWKATDITMDVSTFRLAYRVGPSVPWLPVVVQRPAPTTPQDSETFEGQENWTVAAEVREVEVRAEVGDRAGNSTSVTRRISLLSGGPEQLTSSLPPAGLPPGSAVTARREPTSTPATPWARRSDSAADPYEGGWRSQGFAPAGPQVDAATLPTTASVTAGPSTDSEPTASVPPPTKQDYEPPIANQLTTPTSSPPTQQTMTRSSRFNLDYEMTGIGSFGAARVELWATEDNGQTWRPFGVDSDRSSPFEVETDREGTFGFRLLIHDNGGNSARPPQPGESPDLTVVVDMTQPKVKLLSADFSRTQRNTVVVKWQAADNHLKPRPVRISFAPRPEGPWSIVQSDLPNSGQYVWAPAHRLPGKTYLRVEVADQAGNVGIDETAQPVGAPSGGPRGIIRQVRPVE